MIFCITSSINIQSLVTANTEELAMKIKNIDLHSEKS